MAAHTRRIKDAAERMIATCFLIGIVAQTAQAVTIFSDDFNGSSLDPAWQVLPGQGSYTVSGGSLRYFNSGPTASTTGWYNAALSLSLPFNGTQWELNAKATYNLSWCSSGSYTGPSDPNPGCSSGAQGPQLIVKFDPGTETSTYGGPSYAGTDYAIYTRIIDAYYGSNSLSASYGPSSNGGLLNPADLNISNNIADGTYWYQIIRNGGTLTMNYSSDGVNYFTALTATLSNPSNPYNELLLGGITYSSAGSYTDYDFVEINAVPEPGVFLLALSGLIGLGLKGRRKLRSGVVCN